MNPLFSAADLDRQLLRHVAARDTDTAEALTSEDTGELPAPPPQRAAIIQRGQDLAREGRTLQRLVRERDWTLLRLHAAALEAYLAESADVFGELGA